MRSIQGAVSAPHWLWLSLASIASAFLLGLSAQVRFPLPFSPVPVTLQTFALITMSGLLKRHYALMMVAWYVLLGVLGIPVFAEGGGWNIITGATGGYLVGFFIAAGVVGYMVRTKASFIRTSGLCLLAAALVYLPGLLQLKLVTNAPWSNVLQMGLYPFLLGDIIKSIACGILLKRDIA